MPAFLANIVAIVLPDFANGLSAGAACFRCHAVLEGNHETVPSSLFARNLPCFHSFKLTAIFYNHNAETCIAKGIVDMRKCLFNSEISSI